MAAVWPLGLAGDAFDAGFGWVWQPRATPAKTCDAAYLGAEGSMTIPQWALLGFGCLDAACALWNRRCLSMVEDLTGRVRIPEWQADLPQGGDWYRRAARAHMNCVENLPVFAAIVLCTTAVGAGSRLLDLLAGAILGARICQTTVHSPLRRPILPPRSVSHSFSCRRSACSQWP